MPGSTIGMAERRREDLVRLVGQLTGWIKELDQRLEEEAARRPEVQRLMTHPSVGARTPLETLLVLGPVERSPDAKHLTSYLGLIPEEDSSGARQRLGDLTKQGNRLLRWLLVAAQTASRLEAVRIGVLQAVARVSCRAYPLPWRLMLQERPLLEFPEGLPKFFLCVHDDRAVPRHRLLQRLSRDQKEPDPVLPGL